MIQPSLERIMEIMRLKNYKVYDTPGIDWNINIVGIRAKELVPNKFDDTLVTFHHFLGFWQVSYYPITTDPSIAYLRNPIISKGTAILLEGQYQGAYKIDKHNSRYYALCQKLKDVSIYRDNDRNGTLNLDHNTIETGKFGINIHRGPRNGRWGSDNLKRYSAGCQVFADYRHFSEFMLKCRNGEKAFGNSFTYTLLNEKDFN